MKKISTLSGILFSILVLRLHAQTNWQGVACYGFGNNTGINNMTLGNNKLFVASGNKLYSSTTGDTASYNEITAFTLNSTSINALGVKGNTIVFGTDDYNSGTELYLSNDNGLTWSQSNNQAFGNSYNNKNSNAITIWDGGSGNDSIFVAVSGSDFPRIWKKAVNDPSPAAWRESYVFSNYGNITDFCVFNNKLYAATSWSQLFYTADGVNWLMDSVVGTGYGNGNNYSITDLEVHNGNLFVAFQNYYNGAQLIHTSDGTNYLQDTYDAFWSGSACIAFPKMLSAGSKIYIAGDRSYYGYPTVLWAYDGNFNNPPQILSNGFNVGNTGVNADMVFWNQSLYVADGYNNSSYFGQIWRSCVPANAQISGPTAICLHDTAHYTAMAGAISYAWYINDSLVSTNTNYDILMDSSTVFSLKLVVDNGFCPDSSTISVTVYALPDKPSINDTMVCKGAVISLNDPNIQGNWGRESNSSNSIGGGGPGDIGEVHSVPSLATGYLGNLPYTAYINGPSTYYVVAYSYNSGCYSPFDTVNVGILPGTTYITASQPVICEGDSTTLTAHGGNGYIWAMGSVPDSVLKVAPNVTTTYIVHSNGNSGCADSAMFTVQVNPLPVLTINPPSSTICENAIVTITAQSNTGGSGVWSPIAGLTLIAPNVVNANPSVGNHQYYYTFTSNAGCKDSVSAVVNVNQAPALSLSNNGPVCAGTTLNLMSSSPGAITYSWSGPAGFSSTQSNPSIVNAMPQASGTYQLQVSDASGCTAMASTNVIVESLPNVMLGADLIICEGNSVGLNAVVNNFASTVWTPTNGLNNITATSAIANPVVSTTYVLSATSMAGCVNADTINVVVNPVPVITIGNNGPVCEGTSIALTASGGITYSWSGPAGFNTTTANPVISNASTAANGMYSVTITDANGCTNTASTNVIINPNPLVVLGPDVTVCNGSSIPLNAAIVNVVSSNWTPTSGLSNMSISSALAAPAATTSYILTGTSAFGCVGFDTVTVNVAANPVANAGTDTSICSGDIATVGSSAIAGLNYSWSPASGLSNNTIANPLVSVTNTNATPSVSTYSLIVTDNSTGCTGSDVVAVVVNPLPVINAGADAVICAGLEAHLNAATTNIVSYNWTPATGLDNPSIANPVASPSQTTAYTVSALSGLGCVNSDQITVNVVAPTLYSGVAQYDSAGVIIPIRSGKVKVFDAYGIGDILPLDSAVISANGSFSMGLVPSGAYKILVEPNHAVHPNLHDTYFDNGYSWDAATVEIFNCADTVSTNITLQYVPAPTGNVNISGTVRADDSFSGKVNRQGDPLPGVDISLEQNPGSNLRAATTTDANGYYQFSNVPLPDPGKTYVIIANIPGHGMDSTYVLDLTIGGSYNNYDYFVSDTAIYINDSLANSYNSVKEINAKPEIYTINAYPNPYQDKVTIEYKIKENAVVNLTFYNLVGEQILIHTNSIQAAGNYKAEFSAKSLGLASGMYIARLRINDSEYMIRLIETQ